MQLLFIVMSCFCCCCCALLVREPYLYGLLQDAAKEHYSCPTLQGVELENQGGGGTIGAHWELRVLGVSLAISFRQLMPFQ